MKTGLIYHTERKFGIPVCQLALLPALGFIDLFVTGHPEKIDLVVTLGGDGTILHASSLFSSGAVPPVLSFSMGTLGFLLPFRALVNFIKLWFGY